MNIQTLKQRVDDRPLSRHHYIETKVLDCCECNNLRPFVYMGDTTTKNRHHLHLYSCLVCGNKLYVSGK